MSTQQSKAFVRPDGQGIMSASCGNVPSACRVLRRGRGLQLAALKNIIRPNGQPAPQIFLNIKVVLLAGIQQIFVLRVLGNVKFVAEKRSDALHLLDTLAFVHHRQFVHVHERPAQFLVIDAHAALASSGIRCVIAVYGFLP